MNLNELAKLIAKKEKGRKEISIAQIKEVLAILNDITKGMFYKIVKALF